MKPLKTLGIASESSPEKYSAKEAVPRIHFYKAESFYRDIERKISRLLMPVNKKAIFQELHSFINKLIFYFEERHQHEHDFSAHASHELRTPLAGIRLQTELAMCTNDLELKKKSYRNILISVGKSERLIEQLLVISHFTMNYTELSIESFDLNALAISVMSGFSDEAEKKKILLKIDSKKEQFISANQGSLEILLKNLIQNAINFIPEKSEIIVKIFVLKDKITLQVIDNGPGIDVEQHHAVLKKFKKINSSGSGLGLAIVKRICDIHHATLSFNKPLTSKGLVVSIRF